MPKIAILIPCYNVQNSIAAVLNSFSSDVLSRIDKVVAIDNCSQDNTMHVLKGIQAQKSKLGERLVIIKNSANYGLGGTQKIAFRYFLDNGYSHFFIVHGDGQGNGDDIAKGFFKVFDQSPNVDMIMTSRFMSGANTTGYNGLRVLGNHVFNWITFVCSGHWMTDSGAAIMFVRTKILDRVPFEGLTNSFQFNPELNILNYNLGDLKIIEIPMRWSDSKDKSNISSLNYCVALLKILMRYRFNKTILRKTGSSLFHAESQQIKPIFEIILR